MEFDQFTNVNQQGQTSPKEAARVNCVAMIKYGLLIVITSCLRDIKSVLPANCVKTMARKEEWPKNNG